jgi:hypothetical protein
VVALGLLLAFGSPQTGWAQAGTNPLTLFKNYFVTGDYVVGGVGIRGTGVLDTATQTIAGSTNSFFATGTIHMSVVPEYVANGVAQQANIVAAYLYWETVAPSTVDPTVLAKGTFRGLPIVGTQIASPGTLACSGSGGGNGNQSGAQTLLVYRADVLRYLPYKKDSLTGQPLGQRLVNDADLVANGSDPHTVSLPDTGAGGSTSPSTGNQAYLTEGVSLVVVYRVGGAPLKSVVIYDGGYTFNSVNPIMMQTIQGFYEASTLPANINAQMTHIVGDGRSNFKEQLTVNGYVPTGVSASNPFPGALGPAWDNLTFDVSNRMSGDDASIITMVTPGNPTSTACLSWGAIVFSTTVQNSDGDGLLDIWKNKGLTDISDGSFVDLPNMGAKLGNKDIFVEIDYMKTPGYTNATQGDVPAHTHLPSQAVLDQVGAAYSAKHYHVHFDVGNNYQDDQYVIKYPLTGTTHSGGEAIDEVTIEELTCGTAQPPTAQAPTCLYPFYPGTLSWKNGYEVVKDTYFNHDRRHIFHYALFAHTVGLPRWSTNDKTLTKIVVDQGGSATATVTIGSSQGPSSGAMIPIIVLGAPAASGLNNTAAVPTYKASVAEVASTSTTKTLTLTFSTTATQGKYLNWGLAISDGTPRSNSGVSDVGGGDLMTTLGRWDNFTGSQFMQAAVLFHELGHNLDLGHGGDISDPINCKPNYQSTMNYLFLVRGLLNPSGVPQIDYSNVALPSLNEDNLSESPSGLGAGLLAYLPRWYAPANSSFLDKTLNTTPATKHCDGTFITDGAQAVRVDGTSLSATPIDWDADSDTSEAGLIQDINFDGVPITSSSPVFQGYDDWANLSLQQVGARLSPSASSLDVSPGQDIGDDDGVADTQLAIAGGGLAIAGGGLGTAGYSLGLAIAGGGLAIAGGGLGDELDVEGAKSLGNAPTAFTATVVGSGSTVSILLQWSAPTVGKATRYQVWRAACPNHTIVTAPCSLSPSITPINITPGGISPGPGGGGSFNDVTTKANVVYLYFATATMDDGKQTGASNIVAKSR